MPKNILNANRDRLRCQPFGCGKKMEGSNLSLTGFSVKDTRDVPAESSRVHDLEFMIGEFVVPWNATLMGAHPG